MKFFRTFLVFLLFLLSTPLFAAQHSITSASQFPYTVSVANDTITIGVDNLIASGTLFNIGAQGTVIIGNHYTTTGGSIAGTLQRHDSKPSLVFVGVNNVTIMNWKVRQYYPAQDDSIMVIHLGGNSNIHLDSVDVYVSGAMSSCVFTSGAGPSINIEYGHYASTSEGWYDRQFFQSAVLHFEDNGATGRYPDDLPYRYRIYGITIDSCPHSGINIRGGGIAIIDSNTINMQTHNDFPVTSAYSGAANCFAIAMGRHTPGHEGVRTRISRNTIRNLGGWDESPERSREGGNGISCGGSSYESGAVEVWGNDVRVSQGYDDVYGYNIPSQCFKTEESLDTLLIYDNYFETRATTGSTTDINRKANAIWLAEADENNYWRIYNNRVIVTVDGTVSGLTAPYAVAFENMSVVGQNIQFYDNYFSSNSVVIHWGSMNGLPGSYINFLRDTIIVTSPIYSDGDGQSGAFVLRTSGSSDNTAVDMIFNDGTYTIDNSVDTVTVLSGTPCELTFSRTFTTTVLNAVGLPKEGARVRIRNAYGSTRDITATTGADGVASPVSNIQYYHAGIGIDSTFSSAGVPFIVSAIYGADSVATTIYNVGKTTDVARTLTLTSTDVGATPITSLPYTISTSGLEYVISTDLHATGNAITFADGVHDVILYQDDPVNDTIYWGESGTTGAIGINFVGNNYNVTIRDINLVQNCLVPSSLLDGFNLNTDAFNLPSTVHDVTFQDSYVYIHGQSAQAWYSSENYNIDLRNITWDSDSHAFVDRTGYTSYSLISLNGLNDNTQTGFQYHYRIDRCQTTSANWVNYYIHGTVADVIIDTCDIYMDARNSLSNSGTAGSAEQCYGVVIYGGTSQKVQVTFCTFTSGVTYAGSQGIYVNSEGVDTTQVNGIWIYGNSFELSKGNADEYDVSSIIKLHQNTKNVIIRKNDIHSTGDTDAGQTEYCDLTEGIRVEEIYNDPANIIIDSNTVNITYRDLTAALNFSSTGTQRGAIGIRFDLTSDIGLPVLPDSLENIYCRYNKVTAGSSPYVFGSVAYGLEGVGLEIYRDTIAISDSNTTNYYTFYLIGNHAGIDSSCINRAVDCYYDVASGADPGNMGFINQGDLAVKSTFHVVTVGSNGVAVPNTTVRVTATYPSPYPRIMDDVLTDATGKTVDVLTPWRRRFSSRDSVYNPFTVTATYGSDVSTHSFTLGYTEAGKVDTIVLNNTLGGISVGSPVTISAGYDISEGPLLAIPRYKGGIKTNANNAKILFIVPAQGVNDPAYWYSADDGATWKGYFGGYFSRNYHQSAWVSVDGDYGVHSAYPRYGVSGTGYRYIGDTAWSSTSTEVALSTTIDYAVVCTKFDTTFVASRAVDNRSDNVFIYWSTDHFVTDIHYDTIYMPGDVVTGDNPRVVLQLDGTGNPCLWTLNPGDGWQYYEWQGATLGFVAPSDFYVTGTSSLASNANRAFQVAYAGGMWHVVIGVGSAGTADLHHYTNPNHGTSNTWVLDYISLNSSHGGIEFYPDVCSYHEDTALFVYNTSAGLALKVWSVTDGLDSDSIIVVPAGTYGQDFQVPPVLKTTTELNYMPLWYQSPSPSPFTIYFRKIDFTSTGAPPAPVANLFFRRLRSGPVLD